jgi:catechol 2,3-dioxygenase-like lactoylglutathione lyase family enzyme
MKPKLSLITLGVADLDRSLRFYRDGLGLPTENYDPEAGVVFFRLEGLLLAIWPLAHNEPSREGVDAVFAEALAAGATVVKQPVDTFWGGYAGYFADPDGHLWEVAWNPFTDLT